jgi:signal transduction histidine kinase
MTYRVLLVDDEEQSYLYTYDLLKMSREDIFSLNWLTEFAPAAEALMTNQYDACLLDYQLGAYTGIDLLRYVQDKGCRTPIIILTGHGNREVDIGALDSGAADYLDKSHLRPELLARTIRYNIKLQRDKNQLEDLFRQVSELEQLKTDMIRIAAHDLRTPLTAIVNYATFLRDDREHPLQAYQVGHVKEIRDAAYRMEHIISDILSLERVQVTDDERYLQHTDLATLVHIAAEGARHAYPKPLTFTLDCPITGIVVMGDVSLLTEAAQNLIANALKYTPEGGQVIVRLVEQDGWTTFSVADNGYGIPIEQQTRLFQPFYRARTRETKDIPGTGLGLHLVKQIIERHNGKILFESVYQQGSTFGFQLPTA